MILPPTIEYAIRCLQIIDTTDDVYVTSQFISDEADVPISSLRPRVLWKLAKAGILKSHKGPYGGYGRHRQTNLAELFDLLLFGRAKTAAKARDISELLNKIELKLQSIRI